ncbi:hypothetical protein G9A89_001829 [Geosiphon pyriformis]|nr:hypothetical protein G9A89_001829 [Geosiphon pyriformis]
MPGISALIWEINSRINQLTATPDDIYGSENLHIFTFGQPRIDHVIRVTHENDPTRPEKYASLRSFIISKPISLGKSSWNESHLKKFTSKQSERGGQKKERRKGGRKGGRKKEMKEGKKRRKEETKEGKKRRKGRKEGRDKERKEAIKEGKEAVKKEWEAIKKRRKAIKEGRKPFLYKNLFK